MNKTNFPSVIDKIEEDCLLMEKGERKYFSVDLSSSEAVALVEKINSAREKKAKTGKIKIFQPQKGMIKVSC
ncbi:hypothetical protein A3H53_03960 [Candidatus Nomurabacteria bacterium RIFCSPLOWO2_02_FULL_40_10]|uniref:Uncharacterized protein n=1 Tax=Candidatus Nomurabacteria bacterium RIFCSPLOWO2_02_FULL_40_10 TaxID=1801786 RepID=A0A1F6XVV4_9BACT|nr:MAG: hypothetical protein A3H53_03960 [Candidatus Nomurabacteria bacterium RIFCSPLOWO2_02_FULL_40_10]